MRLFIAIIAFLSLSLSVLEARSDEPARVVLSKRTVMIEGRPFWLHSVERRQTLYSLSQAYGVSVERIKENNPFLKGDLKAGMTLLIPNVERKVAKKVARQKPQDQFIDSVPLEVIKPALESTEQQAAQGIVEQSNLELQTIELGVTRPMDMDRGLNVAMLLPIGGEGRGSDVNFVDFLNGALLASGRLASEGVKVNLDVHSTQVSSLVVGELVSSGKLDAADVIIGPVYDEPFEVAGRWATARRVPIVSPLAGSGSLSNPYVLCMAPTEATKYDKLREIVANPSANVIYFNCQGSMDADMVQAIEPLLPPATRRIDYQGKLTKVEDISSLLVRDMKNIVVIAVSNETVVEDILSRLSSLNAAARFDISVVGTSRWARFANMNLELFFKLKVIYVTSYHSDRANPLVAGFTREYTAAFGTLPTSYSMRGYDALMLVGRLAAASGRRMLYDLPNFTTDLLQVAYRLKQVADRGSKFENVEWSVVSYSPDYRITIL